MAFVQRRKGPDVVGSFGLLQPIADGSKLILKEPISPSSANFSLFRMAPVATFMLSLVARAVVPFDYGMVLSDPNIGLLYLFAISSLGVYGIITAGRSGRLGIANLVGDLGSAGETRNIDRLASSCASGGDLEMVEFGVLISANGESGDPSEDTLVDCSTGAGRSADTRFPAS
ncbi:hypothetical protein MKX03_007014 [Papaver bracteatum]|nr:hypothetical protein MKX03_007873 [Papaver bracteatum]KAI3859951.1 hypothetical protein MKX03_007014 [Papaver bracteatum]